MLIVIYSFDLGCGYMVKLHWNSYPHFKICLMFPKQKHAEDILTSSSHRTSESLGGRQKTQPPYNELMQLVIKLIPEDEREGDYHAIKATYFLLQKLRSLNLGNRLCYSWSPSLTWYVRSKLGDKLLPAPGCTS